MPQANKKRGRRMEGRKRKLEDGDDDAALQQDSKRRKSTDIDGNHDFTPMAELDESWDDAYPGKEKAFFGTLDDEEQEYFRTQLTKLETNSFEGDEGPDAVFADVFREADGKELKLAQSQSCSRLMERVIHQSSPHQLKKLFSKFQGK